MSCSALGNWILARLDRPVLVLEMRRWRHRWRLRGIRAGAVALLLIAWVLLMTESAGRGRMLFGTFCFVQMAAVMVGVAVAGAPAVSSERQNGTLDMICLTRLSPAEIVDQKVCAAMAGSFVWCAIVAPAFLLAGALGGASVMQVLGIVLLLAAVGAALGYVVVFLSCSSSRPGPVYAASLGLLVTPVMLGVPWLGTPGYRILVNEVTSDGVLLCEAAMATCLVAYLVATWLVRGVLIRMGLRTAYVSRGTARVLRVGLGLLVVVLVAVCRPWLQDIYRAVTEAAITVSSPFVALNELLGGGRGPFGPGPSEFGWPPYAATVGSITSYALASLALRFAAIRALADLAVPREVTVVASTHIGGLRLELCRRADTK